MGLCEAFTLRFFKGPPGQGPGASRGLQGPPGASRSLQGPAKLRVCLQEGVEGVFKGI